MTVKQVEERLSKVESIIESLVRRVEAVEKKLEPLDGLRKLVEDADNKQAIHEITVEDRMKDVRAETDSKVVVSELRSGVKIKELGEKLKETVDKVIAVEIKVEELSKEWPTPAEGWTLATNKRNDRKLSLSSRPIVKLSHAEKFKVKQKGTIVLLGDSLTRGVGSKLEYQSNMVSTICRPGARIDTIAEEVSKLSDNVDRHVVLLAGTNDIKIEGSEIILSKYKNLLDESHKLKNRKVSVVGIPRRIDLNQFHNSRRVGVNTRLKEMCEALNVEFIEYEPIDSWLARDGLHLNHLGQNELGYKIYQHCERFLV